MKQANVDIHHEVSLKVFLPLEIRLNNWSPKKPLTKSAIGHSSRRLCLALQMRDEVKSRSPRKKAQIFPRPNREQHLMQHVTSDSIRRSSKLTLFSHSAIFYLLLLHIAPERKEKTFSSRLDPQLQTSKMETFTKSMKAEIIRFWVRSDKRIASARLRRRRSARSWFGLCEP